MVTVTADGITGIRRVDLYVDGVREQADYRGPFLFAWPAFTVPPGTHTLRAILIRTNGSSLRSARSPWRPRAADSPEQPQDG